MHFRKAFYGIAAAIACGAFTSALATPPAGPAFRELGYIVPGFGNTARSRFAVGDVDGDGVEDLIFVGTATNDQVLFVFGKQGGTLGMKQALPLVDTDVQRVLQEPGGGLFTLSGDGKLRHFVGWPLREQSSTDVTANAVSAAIGDVNNDGQLELALCTYSALFVHNLASGNLQWSLPSTGCYDLALAQLDADPALEIVIANTPGKVIDGATQALDWQYKDGFGNFLAMGNFGNGGASFAAAKDWTSFIVFRSAPWSPLWDYAVGDIDALAKADLDGDGVDEILLGDGQWGDVHVVDTATHVDRFHFDNPGYGMFAIASADLDNDGMKEIAFASGASGSDNRTLFVADGQSGALEWSFDNHPGAFTVTTVGDVDGDGRAEQIIGANNSQSSGLRILDTVSGNELWRTPSTENDPYSPFNIAPTRILIGQLDADPQQEIVLAGSLGYGGRIVTLDGVSHQVHLQIGLSPGGPLQNRNVADAALVDFDGDGLLDVVAATNPTYGSSGAKLEVFSGLTGNLLWESVGMGSGAAAIRGVVVGNVDADPQPEMIAVMSTGLRAYDSETQLLEWTLPVASDGAALLPSGAGGAELVVFSNYGTVNFYDATTRAFLRSLTLPAPITALQGLDGDARFLLATSAGRLVLVDGITKQVLASSERLGGYLGQDNQLGTWKLGPQSWHVGTGSGVGNYRYRLDLSELIFAHGFE